MDKNHINILVIDDDEAVRRNLEKTLVRDGYSVQVAPDSLVAQEKIQQSPFHLVISDLQMPGFDGQLSEQAGIELLRWIRKDHPEIFVIMLTGAGTIQTAKVALNLGASDYLEKSQSPSELQQKVSEAIEINFDLKINYGHGTKLKKVEDEEVLRRLFLDSSEINVSLIAQGTKGTAVYQVTSKDLQGRWRVPFATKIAWKDQIRIEEENFQKWVKHRLGGFRYAAMIDAPVYTFRRGGMNMSFLNTELDGLRDFKIFFRTSPTETILKAFTNLFQQTLSYWYQSKEFEVLLLIQAYAGYLNVDQWNLNQHMHRYFKELAGNATIYLEEIDISFPNPVLLFEQLLKSPHDYERRTYVSTVHGDLHASNILVDKQNNCWLIDFTNTGRSHILRDFVELETAIKFHVLETEKLSDLCELETCLMSQDTFNTNLEFSHSNPEIQKAFEVIQLIRQTASDTIAPSGDISEYYLGLLFHSLTMLRFLPEEISQVKKKSILFSASRIFEQLKCRGFQF